MVPPPPPPPLPSTPPPPATTTTTTTTAASLLEQDEATARRTVADDASCSLSVLSTLFRRADLCAALYDPAAEAPPPARLAALETALRRTLEADEDAARTAASAARAAVRAAACRAATLRLARRFLARRELRRRRAARSAAAATRDALERRDAAALAVQRTFRGHRRRALARAAQADAAERRRGCARLRAAAAAGRLLALPQERVVGGLRNACFEAEAVRRALVGVDRDGALQPLLEEKLHHEAHPTCLSRRYRGAVTYPVLCVLHAWTATLACVAEAAGERLLTVADGLLLAAAWHRRVDAVALLLRAGAAPGCLSAPRTLRTSSASALMLACSELPPSDACFAADDGEGEDAGEEVEVEAGTDGEARQQQRRQAAVIHLLVAADPSVSAQEDETGATAVHHAMAACQPAAFDLLTALGADPLHRDRLNRTSVHTLCAFPHPDEPHMVATLLRLVQRHSLPPSLADDGGNIPLHYAALSACAALAAALIDLGAAASKANRLRATPAAVADALREGSGPCAEGPLRRGGPRLAACLFALRYRVAPERERRGRRLLKPRLDFAAAGGAAATAESAAQQPQQQQQQPCRGLPGRGLRPRGSIAAAALRPPAYAGAAADPAQTYSDYVAETCRRNGLAVLPALLDAAAPNGRAALADGVTGLSVENTYLGALVFIFCVFIFFPPLSSTYPPPS